MIVGAGNRIGEGMSEDAKVKDDKVVKFWGEYKAALTAYGVTAGALQDYLRNVDRYLKVTDGVRLRDQDGRDIEFYFMQLFKAGKLDELQYVQNVKALKILFQKVVKAKWASDFPWEEWKARQKPEEAQATWEHISRSPNASIEKARRLLGYEPRYTSFEAVREAVMWLVEKGIVRTA